MSNFKERKQEAIRKKKAQQRLTIITGVIVFVVLFGVLWWTQSGQQSVEQDQFRLASQPSKGDPDAPVKVVEFGDYKCPFCKFFHEEVVSRLNQYIVSREIEFYFINFQFLGPDSTTAGIAGECVLNQNEEAFWQYHDAMYANQGPESQIWATPEFILSLVRQNVDGINESELEQCIANSTYRSAVEQDRQIGSASGVQGTPTIFVNGQKVSDLSFIAISNAIDNALSEGE